MMKKEQKWIALFVILTFVWLTQISVMPLVAADTGEQVGRAGDESGQNVYEAIGQTAAAGRKKSVLPYVLIGVGVVAVAAVLYFFVLKTNYDITGEWAMNYSWSGSILYTFPIKLTGDKKSGSATMNATIGTYAVDGKNVTINTYQGTSRWEFIGVFNTTDRVEGDFKYYSNNVLLPQYNGTFYMVR